MRWQDIAKEFYWEKEGLQVRAMAEEIERLRAEVKSLKGPQWEPHRCLPNSAGNCHKCGSRMIL